MPRRRLSAVEVLARVGGPPAWVAEVREALQREGRVRGFERLRDAILESWETFAAADPYRALKMVLEADRHALFAELAERRWRGRSRDEELRQFQAYLRGEVDRPPVPEGAVAALPAAEESEDVGVEDADGDGS